MAFSNAKMTTLNTTVTAGANATAKVAALLPGFLDVILAEIGKNNPMKAHAQQRAALLRADLVANAATMQTALGL